jgi:hypothetical protein
MAPSRPTSPLLQEIRVIDVSNEKVPGYLLLLEMAFQTKRSVALVQQTLVHGAVRRMTNSATLPQCLVLVDKRAALLCVTLEAGFVFTQESKAAGFELLLDICRSAFDRDAFVNLVTISTTHFAFQHRMMMRQSECGANFQVTLETGLRGLPRIYDGACTAAGLDVQTSGPVAGLAAHVDGLL